MKKYRLNKKALSEIIAYVLLITIALSLSVLVYGWLKNYVPQDTGNLDCPDNIALIIKTYNCNLTDTSFKLNVTITNKGLFTVDGFIIKLNDQDGAKIGLYPISSTEDGFTGVKLKPGESYSHEYQIDTESTNVYTSTDGTTPNPLSKLTFIEVQPFIQKQTRIYCNKLSSQTVSC